MEVSIQPETVTTHEGGTVIQLDTTPIEPGDCRQVEPNGGCLPNQLPAGPAVVSSNENQAASAMDLPPFMDTVVNSDTAMEEDAGAQNMEFTHIGTEVGKDATKEMKSQGDEQTGIDSSTEATGNKEGGGTAAAEPEPQNTEKRETGGRETEGEETKGEETDTVERGAEKTGRESETAVAGMLRSVEEKCVKAKTGRFRSAPPCVIELQTFVNALCFECESAHTQGACGGCIDAASCDHLYTVSIHWSFRAVNSSNEGESLVKCGAKVLELFGDQPTCVEAAISLVEKSIAYEPTRLDLVLSFLSHFSFHAQTHSHLLVIYQHIHSSPSETGENVHNEQAPEGEDIDHNPDSFILPSPTPTPQYDVPSQAPPRRNDENPATPQRPDKQETSMRCIDLSVNSMKTLHDPILSLIMSTSARFAHRDNPADADEAPATTGSTNDVGELVGIAHLLLDLAAHTKSKGADSRMVATGAAQFFLDKVLARDARERHDASTRLQGDGSRKTGPSPLTRTLVAEHMPHLLVTHNESEELHQEKTRNTRQDTAQPSCTDVLDLFLLPTRVCLASRCVGIANVDDLIADGRMSVGGFESLSQSLTSLTSPLGTYMASESATYAIVGLEVLEHALLNNPISQVQWMRETLLPLLLAISALTGVVPLPLGIVYKASYLLMNLLTLPICDSDTTADMSGRHGDGSWRNKNGSWGLGQASGDISGRYEEGSGQIFGVSYALEETCLSLYFLSCHLGPTAHTLAAKKRQVLALQTLQDTIFGRPNVLTQLMPSNADEWWQIANAKNLARIIQRLAHLVENDTTVASVDAVSPGAPLPMLTPATDDTAQETAAEISEAAVEQLNLETKAQQGSDMERLPEILMGDTVIPNVSSLNGGVSCWTRSRAWNCVSLGRSIASAKRDYAIALSGSSVYSEKLLSKALYEMACEIVTILSSTLATMGVAAENFGVLPSQETWNTSLTEVCRSALTLSRSLLDNAHVQMATLWTQAVCRATFSTGMLASLHGEAESALTILSPSKPVQAKCLLTLASYCSSINMPSGADTQTGTHGRPYAHGHTDAQSHTYILALFRALSTLVSSANAGGSPATPPALVQVQQHALGARGYEELRKVLRTPLHTVNAPEEAAAFIHAIPLQKLGRQTHVNAISGDAMSAEDALLLETETELLFALMKCDDSGQLLFCRLFTLPNFDPVLRRIVAIIIESCQRDDPYILARVFPTFVRIVAVAYASIARDHTDPKEKMLAALMPLVSIVLQLPNAQRATQVRQTRTSEVRTHFSLCRCAIASASAYWKVKMSKVCGL